MQVFGQFVKSRVKEEYKEKRSKKQKVREEFKQLLQEAKIPSRYLSFILQCYEGFFKYMAAFISPFNVVFCLRRLLCRKYSQLWSRMFPSMNCSQENLQFMIISVFFLRTTFKEFCVHYQFDQRFNALSRKKEKEALFNDHIKSLKKRNKENRARLRKIRSVD